MCRASVMEKPVIWRSFAGRGVSHSLFRSLLSRRAFVGSNCATRGLVRSASGGTLVTITKLYPGTMRSGKRYGFAQSKEQLDALVKKQQEEGIV